MDLKRLKHLVALADTRNFGRAADLCHLSQSAFSRSIQAAEDELDLQLFVRGTLDVRCTPAGEFVIERARKLLFENRCLERDLALYRERLMGDLAFGVGPYPAATIVPGLLTDLRARFPQVKLRVEVNNAKYLVDHLRAEELDFYLADLRNVPEADDLEFTRIGLLEAGFFVRHGHPLLTQTLVTGADVLKYGLASVQVHDSILLFLGPLMGLPAGTRMPVALECDDLGLLKKVTLETDTILACPLAGAQAELAAHSLVPIAVAGLPTLGSDLGVVALKGRSFSPLARYAVDLLKQGQ
ncbi:MAG: LysR family transcriptional regulator [Burkholderiales bacterium PBB3]|nr:MAG: LysR family transcriptional regulator [Burkholderiales bacterium PBB3]